MAAKTSEEMFQWIIRQNNVFYKSQQRSEADLSDENKIEILSKLYAEKPSLFLTRYYHLLHPDFIPLFDDGDGETKIILEGIRARAHAHKVEENITKQNDRAIRNRRYLALLELKRDGTYFSDENMREREPDLYDTMIGHVQNLDDPLNIHEVVPTTIDYSSTPFSSFLEKCDDNLRISARRRSYLERREHHFPTEDQLVLGPVSPHAGLDRFMKHVSNRTIESEIEEDEIFHEQVENEDACSLSEMCININGRGRHCSKNDSSIIMKKFKAPKTKPEGRMEVEQPENPMPEDQLLNLSLKKKNTHQGTNSDFYESSGDEDDTLPTGIPVNDMRAEFISMMEQRFLDGLDSEFYDYSQIDDRWDESTDKIRDQDLEDAYFDEEEPN